MLYYTNKERLNMNAHKNYCMMENFNKYIKYAITKETIEERKNIQLTKELQKLQELSEKLSNISTFPEHCSYW
jgi:hypothetical protein